jgi:hypothetical protein
MTEYDLAGLGNVLIELQCPAGMVDPIRDENVVEYRRSLLPN